MGQTVLRMVRRGDIVISSKISIPLPRKSPDGGMGRKHLTDGIDA